ncbi:MAG: carbohydrate-binding family 9-like protein [Nannocystaceae bacterium]
MSCSHSSVWPGPLLVGGLLLGCGDPPPEPIPVVTDPGPAGAWNHEVRFEDGVVLREPTTPEQAEPGQPLRITWQASGPVEGRRARLGAWPPRAGSRQVAVGGQGAPPVEVPVDPRARFVEVPLHEGEGAAELTLPSPWHSAQVLLTFELLDGDARIPAVEGPRRHDGVAELALVDVVRRPTAIEAAAMPTAPTLDGRLDEPGWAAAVAVPMVHSLDGEPYDARPSTVRFGWDAEALYVGAEIVDPDVWSEYPQRDDPLWNQEVFEVFVFGDDRRRDYLELQVSPRGTVFDARFERYRKGEPAWNGQWRSAVELRGTLDQRRDRDEGWSAELAIPWSEICEHTEVRCPVAAGRTLRLNAFRFERPRGAAPVGLAVSPPLVPDFHAPENAAVLELGGA